MKTGYEKVIPSIALIEKPAFGFELLYVTLR